MSVKDGSMNELQRRWLLLAPREKTLVAGAAAVVAEIGLQQEKLVAGHGSILLVESDQGNPAG